MSLSKVEFIFKISYFTIFQEPVPAMQFFLFQIMPCDWKQYIDLWLTRILAFFGSFHPQNFDAMVTSDRQYVPRTTITRLVKNEQYQSFQPIVWPEESVSYSYNTPQHGLNDVVIEPLKDMWDAFLAICLLQTFQEELYDSREIASVTDFPSLPGELWL